MEKKIESARKFIAAVVAHGQDMESAINDAANFYADSYSEYMALWQALQA